MELLVAYDVSTETAAGRRRLQRVAKVCQAYGIRVQKSVFECIISEVHYEQMLHRLLQEINIEEDSLRIYRLQEPRKRYLEAHGRQVVDLEGPLIV